MRTILLFQSTHKVMKSERILLQHGIPHKIIPVPKELSSECGMSIEVAPEQEEDAQRVLNELGISVETRRLAP